MTRLKDALSSATKFDRERLASTAISILQRNGGSPTKALVPFVDRLRISPEVRALIDIDYIKDKALAFLDARASEMNQSSPQGEVDGGVQIYQDSQQDFGPAVIHQSSPRGERGGAHRQFDSQGRLGPASHKPVPVTAHSRNRPGNASRGIGEISAAASISPALFSSRLNDGRDLMVTPYFEIKRIPREKAFDGFMAFWVLRYAKVEDDHATPRDIVPPQYMRMGEDLGKRFAKLVEVGVQITIEAFLAMQELPLVAHTATEVQPQG